MSLNKFNPRAAVLVLFIVFAAVARIASVHYTWWIFSNFSLVGAMALFGGVYYTNKWKGFAVPLLSLFVSDLIIQQVFYKGMSSGLLYSGWYIIYLSFALMVFVGTIIKKVSFKNILIASVVIALSHWMVVDFATWLSGGIDINTMQPLSRDMSGLIKCYIQGIPFIKNMLAGNLLYGLVLFGGFELLQYRFPSLQTQTTL